VRHLYARLLLQVHWMTPAPRSVRSPPTAMHFLLLTFTSSYSLRPGTGGVLSTFVGVKSWASVPLQGNTWTVAPSALELSATFRH
jgi:hypothetical protein